MPCLSEKGVNLILASASESRAAMLRNAGVAFQQVPADVDEPALRHHLKEQGIDDAQAVAAALARAKALAVSQCHADATVIGADQVLAYGGEILEKPGTRDRARAQLMALRGGTHALQSAVCLARNGNVVWQTVATARITFRAFSERFLDRYLDEAGEPVFNSLGACQIEALGIHLLSDIDGDFFTILGMPLLPLLSQLRKDGLVAN